MKKPETHPDLDQLAAFGQGKPTEMEASEIATHLDTCLDCRNVVDNQPDDGVVALLRQAISTCSEKTATLIESWLPSELLSHPRYRLVRWLGAGGMGVVYQAEHRLMERPVAVKVISKNLTAATGAVERFQREVKAAAKLSHPNIVASYDAEHAGDLHFLVMEFIDGTSLARLVEDQGPLPVNVTCEYVRQTALGLQHAWEHGLVHRDIKPQNLMLTPKGQIKILDFGLAGVVSEGESAGSLTGFGQGLGTPDYVAPEQIRDAHSADVRADIYSLGCTFYYLLTGQPPFPEGSVSQKIASHLERTPKPISDLRGDVPPGLSEIVARMMAKNAEQRYQKPVEVAEALALFSGRKNPTGVGSWQKRNRSLLAVGALGVVGIASVFVVGLPGTSGLKGTQEEKPLVAKVKDEKKDAPPDAKPPASKERASSRFSEIDLEEPFDKYLLANPLLMEISGAKVIRLPGGNQVILSVASTILKDNSPAERLRVEKVCRIKAIASVVAEKEGVHVYRFEELKEQTVVALENGQEKGKSVSELLELTRTKVEGIAKDMPVIGRWKSRDGAVYYLAIGLATDRKGKPLPQNNP